MFSQSALALMSVASMASTVVAAGAGSFSCGSEAPSNDFFTLSHDFAANHTMAVKSGLPLEKREDVTIDLYITTLSSAPDRVPGDDRLQKQIELLNSVFQPHGFTFNHKETARWVAPGWANNEDEQAMKKQMRKGAYRDLNIYIIEESHNSAAGWCTLPGGFKDQGFAHDGCTLTLDILASDDISGRIAIHEVGHWMGLMHTHEGGCEGNNDGVFDTPAENFTDDFSCNEGRDSCPDKEGLDNIHNYMAYVHDTCMTEFTPGQSTLMHDMWKTFRV